MKKSVIELFGLYWILLTQGESLIYYIQNLATRLGCVLTRENHHLGFEADSGADVEEVGVGEPVGVGGEDPFD
jgi:hypothetical protein